MIEPTLCKTNVIGKKQIPAEKQHVDNIMVFGYSRLLQVFSCINFLFFVVIDSFILVACKKYSIIIYF